jgi:hypothetical protein
MFICVYILESLSKTTCFNVTHHNSGGIPPSATTKKIKEVRLCYVCLTKLVVQKWLRTHIQQGESWPRDIFEYLKSWACQQWHSLSTSEFDIADCTYIYKQNMNNKSRVDEIMQDIASSTIAPIN